MNNESVDAYLARGCGRCAFFDTPQCKVHLWTPVLVALRALLNSTELGETMKWGTPVYTVPEGNVVVLSALKDRVALGFFKGALLEAPAGTLVQPGPNTHEARQLHFTAVEEVQEQRALILDLIGQAIHHQRAGTVIEKPKVAEPMPDELQQVLDGDPAVAAAFEALTPGRQRSYRLHVGGAKQSATRASRAEKCIPKILTGKGFNER